MKTFITFMPRQPESGLATVQYKAGGNAKLEYGPTRFPIIPVINGYTEEGEQIRVIVPVEDYDNCKRNIRLFEEELAALCEKKHLICESIEKVDVPYDDSVQSQIEVFEKLIAKINDQDILHACITFGSKPSPMVEMMALRYARQIRKAYIACVVYGQLDHNTVKDQNSVRGGTLYDETALVKLDDIVQILVKSKPNNPDEMLRKFIHF